MIRLIIALTAAALIFMAAGNAAAENREDAGNVEFSEVSITQFPCQSWETTYTCALRALREEFLGEKPPILRFV